MFRSLVSSLMRIVPFKGYSKRTQTRQQASSVTNTESDDDKVMAEDSAQCLPKKEPQSNNREKMSTDSIVSSVTPTYCNEEEEVIESNDVLNKEPDLASEASNEFSINMVSSTTTTEVKGSNGKRKRVYFKVREYHLRDSTKNSSISYSESGSSSSLPSSSVQAGSPKSTNQKRAKIQIKKRSSSLENKSNTISNQTDTSKHEEKDVFETHKATPKSKKPDQDEYEPGNSCTRKRKKAKRTGSLKKITPLAAEKKTTSSIIPPIKDPVAMKPGINAASDEEEIVDCV